MHKLFIIGNGFDLAHELKTKYSDFLLWYMNKRIRSLNSNRSISNEDDLLSIDGEGYIVKAFNSLEEIRIARERKYVTINCKNEFLSRLMGKYINANWVDIEYEYYQVILAIHRKYESYKTLDIRRVVNLNKCLD